VAKLKALPGLDVIRGYKGVLDFYVRKGVPCVRRWPRRPTGPGTQAQIAARATFGRISTDFRTLAPLALQAFQEAAKDQPRTARDLYISAVFGHLHETSIPPEPPPEEEMYDAYVCLRDQKGQNTSGGDFTAGAWQTRDLNDEHADPEGICVLLANQFTLAAGTYRAIISCPAYRVNGHQARLLNVTGPTVLLVGTSERAYADSRTTARSCIVGRFTIEADQTLEVQHRCRQTFAGEGFGWPCNLAPEIYTVAEFWREIA